MKLAHVVAGVAASAFAWGAVADQLVWDNYPGDTYLPLTSMSSERNTQIVEPSYTVDDVQLQSANVPITRIEWVGARTLTPGFSKADVIFLDSNFNTLAEYQNLTSISLADVIPDPNPDPNVKTYIGNIDFAQPISLSTSYFYVGVRLVGDGMFQGRNYWVTHSTTGAPQGQTGGYFKNATLGAPYWRPASDVWNGTFDGTSPPFEFAFRVYSNVPEPSSLILLGLGALGALRRR